MSGWQKKILFTTNLMMKRLAVGGSFFHAGALIESMIFSTVPAKVIVKFTKQAFRKEKTEIMIKEEKQKTLTNFEIISKLEGIKEQLTKIKEQL